MIRPLREAHTHVAQLGRAMAMVDLSGCAHPAEMLDRLGSASPDANGWVLAHGAVPQAWDPPGWPNLAQLDAVTGSRPTLAWCFDYHALIANSAALRRVGIDANTRFERGRVEFDHASEPTGVLLEHAALAAWNAVPEPDEPARRAHVRDALTHLASLGFVEVHDLKAQPWLPETLASLGSAGELGCGVALWPLVEDLPPIAARRRSFESDRIRLGGGKVFTDGTLNSRTAHMLAPYADGPPEHPAGMAMLAPEEIDAAVRTCDAFAVPIAAHAIGDAAVRAVLDSIERVKPRATGQRIEHAEVIDAADVRRFAELGVVCSVQPCHLLTDIEALQRAIPDRLDRVLPLRELIDAGLVPGRSLVFGSDAPIVRADPGDSILAATKRRRADMAEADAIAPEQAISEAEAWACFDVEGQPPWSART